MIRFCNYKIATYLNKTIWYLETLHVPNDRLLRFWKAWLEGAISRSLYHFHDNLIHFIP